MILFLLRKCSKAKKQAVEEILSNDKFALITTKPEEGITTELNNNLSYEELFNLYRKYRKKYFKLKNLYDN